MKKAIRLISLLMALILGLCMFTGCSNEGEGSLEEPKLETYKMTIGIPVGPNDAEWADWESVLSTIVSDFEMFYSFKVSFTKIPLDNEKEMKKFIKKVENGKVACFFTSREEFVDTLIEKEALLPFDSLQSKYEAFFEKSPAGILQIAEDSDLKNYMFPLYGSFQGLYYNRTLFKEHGIENPTSWDNLLAAIATLKEKGITPIAAGFKDEGLDYMVEELIMTEGGAAEHSYQPTFGVISSWERAVADIKTLQGLGAFTPDCYNVTFDSAVESFLNGTAAMIVAPSTAFGGKLPMDDVKVVGFPCTPTGRREEGSFIGEFTHGMYISKEYFTQMDEDGRYTDAIAELLGKDYLGSADFYDIFKDESTIYADFQYYKDLNGTNFEDSLGKLVEKATAADVPMRNQALTFDKTIECFRKALTGADVQTALQEATDAEIAAADALAKAEEK